MQSRTPGVHRSERIHMIRRIHRIPEVQTRPPLCCTRCPRWQLRGGRSHGIVRTTPGLPQLGRGILARGLSSIYIHLGGIKGVAGELERRDDRLRARVSPLHPSDCVLPVSWSPLLSPEAKYPVTIERKGTTLKLEWGEGIGVFFRTNNFKVALGQSRMRRESRNAGYYGRIVSGPFT